MKPFRLAPGNGAGMTPRFRSHRWLHLVFGLCAVLIACTSVGDVVSEPEPSSATASSDDRDPATILSPGDQAAALERLAELLEALYVFPEVGVSYARDLRLRKESGALVAQGADEFATAITKNLRHIHEDGHLRVEVMNPEASGPAMRPPPPPRSLDATWRPTPAVAYLRFSAFWGDPETMTALREFLEANADAKVLIIDLRTHRGGGLAEIDLLASELFAEPTDLLVMEVRRTIYDMDGGPFQEGPTLQKVERSDASVRLLHQALPAAAPRWLDTSLYLLTSPTTASAAEHFALAMQRTGRATLVGTPTKGAAHFGGMMPIGAGLQAFIPAGRTYDPDTGKSWEGTGVQPDIATAPQQALLRALEASGLSEAQAEEIQREGVKLGKVPTELPSPMN